MAALARRRLSRAELYLDLAEQRSADREQFSAHFETFVVYGRSALPVLKKEVDAAGVFACFKPEWKALWEEALPTFFRDARDTVLKVGVEGAGRRAEYAVTLTATARPIGRLTLVVHRADGSVARPPVVEQPPAETTQNQPTEAAEVVGRYFFTEGPFKDQEVFRVGRQYLARLAQAIQVAENCGA